MLLFFFTTPPAARPQVAPLREKLLQMDPVGTVLIMGGIISYILALQYGGVTYAWSSPTVVGLVVAAGVIFILFGLWEWHQGERATIAPRLISQRVVWVNGVTAMLLAGSYFLFIYYLPIYFQSIDNVDPTESGVRNLPIIIALTIMTIVSGASISANGHAAPLLVGGAALATIAAGLLYTVDIGTESGKWIGYQILAGLGYGVSFQIPMITVQASMGIEDLAAVTAILNCTCPLPFALHPPNYKTNTTAS